jgi:hypothetical protein
MFAVSVSGIALASDIYKSTDENGNVHYGDRPTGDESEELLDIISRPTDPSAVQARVQSRRQAREDAGQTAEQEEADEPSEEELRATAEERARKCETYKARLQKYVTSRRLYRQDENGERVYLDEEQTQTARERVENQVQEHCNS